MSDRASTLASAYLPNVLTIAGQDLRPMTGGSMMILQQFRNPLFAAATAGTAPVDDPAAEDADRVREDYLGLLQFVWVHTAPIDEVIAAAEAGEEGIAIARKAAWRLALEYTPEQVTQFGQQFAGLKARVEAAMTEAIPEGPPGKPAPSPTGLPAWSGPSAGQGTPSGSDGSSGTSPSTAPSSTSTPDSATTAAASAGPSPAPAAASPSVIPLPSLPPPAANG